MATEAELTVLVDDYEAVLGKLPNVHAITEAISNSAT